MCRVVQDWIARPFHPELDRYLRAGVSCSYCKFCAECDIFPEERGEVGASPGGARQAGSKGERGRGKARKPGSKSPRTWGGGGPDVTRGGGSDMIQFVRRPKSLGRNTGRFGQTPYRIQPPEGPKTDLETTNREGFQNR